MSHVDNDKNIQQIKLSNENSLRHKTLIFIGNKANIISTKSYVINLIKIKLSRKNQLNYSSMGEIRNKYS